MVGSDLTSVAFEPRKENKEGRNAGKCPDKQRIERTGARHLSGECVPPRKILNLKFFLFSFFTAFLIPEFWLSCSPERERKNSATCARRWILSLLPEHWVAVASNAALKAKGIHLQGPDLPVATVAHARQLPLLAKDVHFEMIGAHVLSELKIVPN